MEKKYRVLSLIKGLFIGNKRYISFINLLMALLSFLKITRPSAQTKRIINSLLYDFEVDNCLARTIFYKDPFYFNLFRLGLAELEYLYDKTVNKDIYGSRLLTGDDPVVLDIGAHIGTLARYILETRKNAVVFSFEPDKENFKLLEKNLANYKNSTAVQKGIYNKPTQVELAVSNRIDWRSSLKIDDNFFKQDFFENDEYNSSYSVETITIDSFIEENQIEKVDLMKITVPGEIELMILEGAHNTIQKHKPVIAISTYSKNYTDVLNYFSGIDGYKKISEFGNIKKVSATLLFSPR